MKKKIYITPCVKQVEFVPESCLASSTAEESEVDVVTPDPWKEGNVNWW